MPFWSQHTPLLNLILQAEETDFLRQELGFVILLTISAGVAIFVRRFVKLPYTVALVLVGLVLSFFPNFLGFTISSNLILDLLVPPLIFEATLHIKWTSMRRNLIPILLLAVVGVIISTLLVGEIVSLTLGIPIAAAVAFGALISATDPVAVIAFFRSLGVSKRLALLVEGESLFNDGVAIVVFSVAVGLTVTAGETSFNLIDAVIQFMRVAFGGLAVGTFLGLAVSQLVLRHVDDNLIETATTVALAFGAFVLAEEFHLSGILAVVAAGLFVGNVGFINTSPTTRITLENFWEFLAFVTNSIIFLIIGLEVELLQFGEFFVPVIVAVVTVLLCRAIVVYTITWFSNRVDPRNFIPRAYRHVMFWGGLRGAISLALVLTLSSDVFGEVLVAELRVMTFGVVLFTLLFQGLTIAPIIRRLGLSKRPAMRLAQQREQGLIYMKQSGKRELDRLRDDGILPAELWKAMDRVYTEEMTYHDDRLQKLLRDHPELAQEMVLLARVDLLRAERTAVSDAFRRGLLAEDVYDELIRETDNRAAALDRIIAAQRLGSDAESSKE